MDELNAWHMSIGALDSFVAPDSDWGHYMTTIDEVEAPADYSWWWALHYWEETNESWMVSDVGMDSWSASNTSCGHPIPQTHPLFLLLMIIWFTN